MDNWRSVCNVSDLVVQYYSLLYRYAYRLSGSDVEAEDLTQQTFLTAHSKLHQLRRSDHAKAWLFSILRNTFLKNLRGTGNTRTVSLDDIAEPADEALGEVSSDPQEFQAVLNELPEEFRTPLILYYFEEFSYKQIAEQMEIPMGTVMSRLARAKKYLRKRLTVFQPAARG